MNSDEVSLYSSFEWKGQWFLPTDVNDKRAGVAKYSPGNITLEMEGLLPEVGEGSGYNYPLLYGYTNVGPVTLVRVEAKRVRKSFSGRSSATFEADFLVAGEYLTWPNIPAIRASFACSHLDSFLATEAFKMEVNTDGTETLTYKPSPAKRTDFNLPESKAKVSLKQRLETEPGGAVFKLTAFNTIAIEPNDKPQSFIDWYVERIWRICDLLTLLTDETVRPERLDIELNEDGDRCLVFWRVGRPAAQTDGYEFRPLFTLDDVKGQFAYMLDRWLSAPPTLVSAIHMFLDAFRHGGLGGSAEGRLVALCQSFEALTRATNLEADYMPEAEYKKVHDDIVAAIRAIKDARPNGFPDGHFLSLTNKIGYGNQFSLRRRFKKAMVPLKPLLSLFCKGDGEAFRTGVVNTRNFLTHYTCDDDTLPLVGEDRVWASERLAMLLRILFLRDLKIDDDLIRVRIEENFRLSHFIRFYSHFREQALPPLPPATGGNQPPTT